MPKHYPKKPVKKPSKSCKAKKKDIKGIIAPKKKRSR